jgi:golgi phosphoprotein 3
MPHLPPLTILEEFLLLALDERRGEFWPVSRSAFDCATACAILMDLMRLRRIDCDTKHVFVTNQEPTGDELLDPVLAALVLDPVRATRAIIDELSFLSDEAEALRDHVIQRLIERDILGEEQRKILWIFGSRRFPVNDDKELRYAKLRVLDTVLGRDVPDPRDAALVSLLFACGMFPYILNPQELSRCHRRIAQVAQMDVLGRATAEVVAEVETSIAMASGLR